MPTNYTKPSGIHNIGNNCYIISAIQLVSMIAPIKKIITKDPKPTNNTLQNQQVAGLFEILRLHLNTNEFNRLATQISRYKRVLGFNSGQDDTVIFLNLILDLLSHKDIWATEVKKKLYKYNDNAAIEQLSRDIKNHKYVASNVTEYNIIELQFDSKKDDNKFINELLNNQSARHTYEIIKNTNGNTPLPPIIEYDNKKVYEIVDYYYRDYIIVRIQAFDHNYNKKFHKILLCMNDYCITLSKTRYRLTAVISHIGSTINSGHYVCYVNIDNNWYRCDDGNVQHVNDSFLNPLRYSKELPYVILYSKIQ